MEKIKDGYYLIKDVQRVTKWPRFNDGLFAGMIRLNCDMEQAIAMMRKLKEDEGFVDVDEAIMCRLLDNFKEILELTDTKKVKE